jgi:hypothetical protein
MCGDEFFAPKILAGHVVIILESGPKFQFSNPTDDFVLATRQILNIEAKNFINKKPAY